MIQNYEEKINKSFYQFFIKEKLQDRKLFFIFYFTIGAKKNIY